MPPVYLKPYPFERPELHATIEKDSTGDLDSKKNLNVSANS